VVVRCDGLRPMLVFREHACIDSLHSKAQDSGCIAETPTWLSCLERFVFSEMAFVCLAGGGWIRDRNGLHVEFQGLVAEVVRESSPYSQNDGCLHGVRHLAIILL